MPGEVVHFSRGGGGDGEGRCGGHYIAICESVGGFQTAWVGTTQIIGQVKNLRLKIFYFANILLIEILD